MVYYNPEAAKLMSQQEQEQVREIYKETQESTTQQTTTVPKTTTTTTTTTITPETQAERDTQLQQAIDVQDTTREQIQQAIDSGSLSQDYLTQYDESIQDIQAKQDIASNIKEVEQSYSDAGVPIPAETQKQIDQMKEIVYGEASPFTTVQTTDKGIQVSTDIPNYLRYNPTQEAEATLKRMGITPERISEARNYIASVDETRAQRLERSEILKELDQYAVRKNGEIIGYNIDKAILAGDLALIQTAGFSGADINNALIRTGKAGTTKQDVTMMAAMYPGLYKSSESISKPNIQNAGFANLSGYGKLTMGAPGTLSGISFEDWLKTRGMTESIRKSMTSKEIEELRDIYEKDFQSTLPPIGQRLIVGRGPGEQVYLPSTGEWVRKDSLRGFLEGWTAEQERQQAQFDLLRSPEGMTGILQAPEKIYGVSRGAVMASPIPVVGTIATSSDRWRTMSDEEKKQALYNVGFDIAWTGANIFALGFNPNKPITTTAKVGTSIEKMTTKTPTTKVQAMYTQEMPGTEYVFQNPAIWERGAPLKTITGEMEATFKTPVSSLESFGKPLSVRYSETGGIYRPEYYIGKEKIPIEEFKPYNIRGRGDIYTITEPPRTGGGTQTVTPSTATMTPEQVARLTGAYNIQMFSPVTPLTSGLVIPKPSTVISTSPVTITQPEIETPKISPAVPKPAEVTFEEITGMPKPSEGTVTISPPKPKEGQETQDVVIEQEEIITEPETFPIIPTPIPPIITTTITPPDEGGEDTGDGGRVPPPPVPPWIPDAKIYGSGGSGSRKGKPQFIGYTMKIPKLVVYMPSWIDEDFEDTPFGKRTAMTVVPERKLKAGTKQVSRQGITSRRKGIIRNDSGFTGLVR